MIKLIVKLWIAVSIIKAIAASTINELALKVTAKALRTA